MRKERKLPDRKTLALQLRVLELKILTQAKSEVVQLLLDNDSGSGSNSARTTEGDSDTQEVSLYNTRVEKKRARLL